MSSIEVKAAEPRGELAGRLLNQFEGLIDRVCRRAYDLFEKRGRQNGGDLEDWYRAEEELFFPVTFSGKEEPGGYSLRLSIPGFKGKDLKVYTLGNRLIVKGDVTENRSDEQDTSSEEHRSIFYQWAIPVGARLDGITAELKDDALMITIPIDAMPKAVQIANAEPPAQEPVISTVA